MVGLGETLIGQTASLIITWAMVRFWGPALRRVMSMLPGLSSVRSTLRASTGAGWVSCKPPPVLRKSTITPARTTRGRISSTAEARLNGFPLPSGIVCSVILTTLLGTDIQVPGPAQLGKFGIVGMEHVLAGEFIGKL